MSAARSAYLGAPSVKPAAATADNRRMTYLPLILLVGGVIGLVVTLRGARTELGRAEEDARQPYRALERVAEDSTVRDLQSIATKVLAGSQLTRRERRRVAVLVRRLERRY